MNTVSGVYNVMNTIPLDRIVLPCFTICSRDYCLMCNGLQSSSFHSNRCILNPLFFTISFSQKLYNVPFSPFSQIVIQLSQLMINSFCYAQIFDEVIQQLSSYIIWIINVYIIPCFFSVVILPSLLQDVFCSLERLAVSSMCSL